MTATTTFRRHLDNANIPYTKRGDYNTLIRRRKYAYNVHDCYNGLLRVSIPQMLDPSDAVRVITGPEAVMTVTVDDDGIVGHAECGRCGQRVDQSNRYCPWCGARFTDKESK